MGLQEALTESLHDSLILLVDDDPFLLKILTTVLRTSYRIKTADGGATALALAVRWGIALT